jgi:hypothetical protein
MSSEEDEYVEAGLDDCMAGELAKMLGGRELLGEESDGEL